MRYGMGWDLLLVWCRHRSNDCSLVPNAKSSNHACWCLDLFVLRGRTVGWWGLRNLTITATTMITTNAREWTKVVSLQMAIHTNKCKYSDAKYKYTKAHTKIQIQIPSLGPRDHYCKLVSSGDELSRMRASRWPRQHWPLEGVRASISGKSSLTCWQNFSLISSTSGLYNTGLHDIRHWHF